jgi:dipeptidyl aminopeptidase/acylaminoacyl peptidase
VTDGSEGFEGSGGYPGVSSRVEAVAALGGISDLTQGPDHTELDFFGPEWAFSTWAGPSPELTDASPITWASSDDPPFLIVHGTEDTLVDSAQAQRLFDELDGVGANATLQLVTNGSHSLSDSGGTASPSKAELATLIADFLDTHVRFVS